MIQIDNKILRNLEEQVLANKDDIEYIINQEGTLNQFGLKVIEEITPVSSLPSEPSEYDICVLISGTSYIPKIYGTYSGITAWFSNDATPKPAFAQLFKEKYSDQDSPYGLCWAVDMDDTTDKHYLFVFTRANSEHTSDYMFAFGEFPLAGPQGEQGETGETGPTGATGPIGYSILTTSQALTPSMNTATKSYVRIPTGYTVKIGDILFGASTTYSNVTGMFIFKITAIADTYFSITYIDWISKGAKGDTGEAGDNGQDGKSIYSVYETKTITDFSATLTLDISEILVPSGYVLQNEDSIFISATDEEYNYVALYEINDIDEETVDCVNIWYLQVAEGSTYTAGSGISISNNEISVDTDTIATKASVTELSNSLNTEIGRAENAEGILEAAILNKMDKLNPTGTGSFSLNRLSGSTVGDYSFAAGLDCTASAEYTFAVGDHAVASKDSAHAEGYYTTASKVFSHAEGNHTTSSGGSSHAEGAYTVASSFYTHAEGYRTTASREGAHAEGQHTIASGVQSHAEGWTTEAEGSNSHAEGDHTKANHRSQHVFGEYNILDPSTTTIAVRGNYVEIVGNGTEETSRSNARTLDWSGNEVLAGNLQAAGLTDGTTTKTMSEVLAGTVYTAGSGINISNSEISVDTDTIATKTYVDEKVVGVYIYKGSVATYADLPTLETEPTMVSGWVYNVVANDMNYAAVVNSLVGTLTWDPLGTTFTPYTAGTGIEISNNSITVDQSFVATKASVQALEQDKQDKLTAGANITIENNVISATGGSSNTYIATYQTTTREDLKTAFDANKIIFCWLNAYKIMAQLQTYEPEDTSANTPERWIFGYVARTGTNKSGVGYILLEYEEATEVEDWSVIDAHQIDIITPNKSSSEITTTETMSNIDVNGVTYTVPDYTYTEGTGIDISDKVISIDSTAVCTIDSTTGKILTSLLPIYNGSVE